MTDRERESSSTTMRGATRQADETGETLRRDVGDAQVHVIQHVNQEHSFANLVREFSLEGLVILLPGFGFVATSVPASGFHCSGSAL